MHVLLIQPPVHDFKLYDEWMHPLGLYLLASFLKHNGCTVRFLNLLTYAGLPKRFGTGSFNASPIEKPDLYKDIPRYYKRYGMSDQDIRHSLTECEKPDCVMMTSAMTYWLGGVVEAGCIVKENYPDVPLVIGGIGARLCTSWLRDQLPGAIIFDGNLFSAPYPFRHVHPSVSSFNTHGWIPDLIDGMQLRDDLRHGPALLSTGCPYSCEYCASNFLQGGFCRRDSGTIRREYLYLKEQGLQDICLYDDALLIEPKTGIVPFCKDIIADGSPFRIHTPNGLHVRMFQEPVAARMKEAGFVTLRFGYESGDDLYAGATSGKSTLAMLREKASLALRLGWSSKDLGAYVMAGLDNQTPGAVIQELRNVASCGIRAMPVFLSPVPHTKQYERYLTIAPKIAQTPLAHNDAWFITQLPGWSVQAVEEVRAAAREVNGSFD